MHPSSEGRLERDGVQGPPRSLGEASDFVGPSSIHYVEWHPDHAAPALPAVLFLHGLSSNARYWDRVASRLRQRRLVALDLTPATPERAHMEQLLMDAAFAVEQLRLDRPVVVGHSWGAGLALELVARNPALASGLVFVDGPVYGVARIFSWDEVEARMQPDFPRYATLEDAMADTKSHLHEAWGEDLRPFVASGLMRDGDALVPALTAQVRLQILRDLYGSDPRVLWPRVQVPAAALIARKSDARISRSTDEGMLRVAEIAPAVAIKRFETPHDIPLYAPVEVAQEIEAIARSTIWV